MVVGVLNVGTLLLPLVILYVLTFQCDLEVDIYDGDHEPMIFHGKTFTSKVSVREVCQAIAKYGFVASPYPVIISAEIHCGLVQQDMLVDIMSEVFGESLVHAPVNGRPKLDVLPSPEDLKGRILLKVFSLPWMICVSAYCYAFLQAKNLYISPHETADGEFPSTDTSASSTSDSDAIQDVKVDWSKVKHHQSDAVKGAVNVLYCVHRY